QSNNFHIDLDRERRSISSPVHTLEDRKTGSFHLRHAPGGQRWGESRVDIVGAKREKLLTTIAKPLVSGHVAVDVTQRDRIKYLNSIGRSIHQVAKDFQRLFVAPSVSDISGYSEMGNDSGN